jgi:predicted XRE-type DNA-binding protein
MTQKCPILTDIDGPETWLPAPGFEADYLISNYGRVSSRPGVVRQREGFMRKRPAKILSPCDDGRGYWQVILSVDGKDFHARPHRLVAAAFISPPPDIRSEVHHIDFDRKNNRRSNLAWCSAQQNVDHSTAAGNFDPYKNPNNRIKLTPEMLAQIQELLTVGDVTQKEIARAMGVDPSMISHIKRNKRWKT